MTAGFNAGPDVREALGASIRGALKDGADATRSCWSDPQAWRPLWDRARSLDLPGLVAPEAVGGSGAGVRDLCAALEAVGRTLAPIPLLFTASFCVPLLAAAGQPAVGAALGRLIGEGQVAAYTMADRDTTDAIRVDAVAELPRADVVVIDLGDQVAVCEPDLVRPDAAPVESVDPASPVGRIETTVDRVQAGICATLPRPAADLARAAGRCAAAAELTGLARRALDAGIAHANLREQFGRPIATFQAVKHTLADAYVDAERAHSLWEQAAELLDEHADDADEAIALSHLAAGSASEAAVSAARAALRVHGAMGVTWEHDAHLVLRRVRHRAQWLGPADEHFARGAAGLWALR
jgi:alkylation response protein AidB-like acyl-CoA dehydrogenase